MTTNRDTRAALMDFCRTRSPVTGFRRLQLCGHGRCDRHSKSVDPPSFSDQGQSLGSLDRAISDNLQHRLAEIEAAHATAGARLKALIALYRAALDGGHTVCLCVAFSTCRDSLSEVVIARVSAVRAMVLQWITATFELGQRDGSISAILDPADEAPATLAMLEGAHLAARTEEDLATFDAATRLLNARCQ